MNPYNRFSLFSSSVTAALILAVLAVSGQAIFKAVQQFGTSPTELGIVAVAAVTIMVVFWMAFTEVILPSLFRLNWVRKMILGRYYIEGTWLQAEKGQGAAHIAVIDIQPNGKNFTFSGYALDENLDVNSNVLLELAKFDWPFLTFKYRNSLSDGSDGQRDGVGEVQFEMNQASARRYNGFSQYIKSDERKRLEGTKLTRATDVRRLRTLEGREEIVDHYWDLFFGREDRRLKKARQMRPVAAAETARKIAEERVPAPVVDDAFAPAHEEAPLELTQPAEERRTGHSERPSDLEEHVIPRRRATDWKGDEAEAEGNDPGVDLETADADPQNVEADVKPADEAMTQKASEEPEKADQASQKRVFDARHVM